MTAPLDEKLQNVKWGELKIGELFDKVATKKLKKKVQTLPKHKTNQNDLPALTAGTSNQGLSCYVPRENSTVLKNVISIASNGSAGSTYYQPFDFTILQDAYAINLKNRDFTQQIALYFVAIFQKSLKKVFSWGDKALWNKVKNTTLSLPITLQGDIDFDFMQDFVEQIEQEQIKKLQEYLQKQGLYDTRLTKDEEKALKEFDNLEWGEFKVGELFTVYSNPQLNKDSFAFSTNGRYPYFTRTEKNNGILGYVDYLDQTHKISGNSIAVGMMAMSFFYMKNDFYAGQFTKTIYPKFKKLTEKIALYFITLLNNSKKRFKNVLVRDFEKVFYDTIITLPITLQGDIDFDFMQNYIAAIQKLCIKNVMKEWNSAFMNS